MLRWSDDMYLLAVIRHQLWALLEDWNPRILQAWRLAIEACRMEDGGWRMVDAGWVMVVGGWFSHFSHARRSERSAEYGIV